MTQEQETYTPERYVAATLKVYELRRKLDEWGDQSEKERRPVYAMLKSAQAELDLLDLELEDSKVAAPIVRTIDLNSEAVEMQVISQKMENEILSITDEAETLADRLDRLTSKLESLAGEIAAKEDEAMQYDGRLDDSTASLTGYMAVSYTHLTLPTKA